MCDDERVGAAALAGQMVRQLPEAVAGHARVVEHHQPGQDAADQQAGQDRSGGASGLAPPSGDRVPRIGRPVEGAQLPPHPAFPAPLLAALAPGPLHAHILAGQPQRRSGYSHASPSGLATATTYPSGSLTQISRWPGPLPWPSGGLRCGAFTTSAPEPLGTLDHAVEVADGAEPDEYAVAARLPGVADRAVVVVGAFVVELQDQLAVREQPLVVGPAVVAGRARAAPGTTGCSPRRRGPSAWSATGPSAPVRPGRAGCPMGRRPRPATARPGRGPGRRGPSRRSR